MGYPRAKIIATIGPSSNQKKLIHDLVKTGVNVFRLNFSHGSQQEHLEVIKMIQIVRQELNEPIAIMMDTKGYEIRVDPLPNKQISIEKNKTYRLGKNGDFNIHPYDVIGKIEQGMEILFDDGYLVAQCKGHYEDGALLEFKNERILKENKNCHIPNARLTIPDITQQDRSDILFAIKAGIDLIAVSFVVSKQNILAIKQLLLDEGCEDVGVIAKIETTKAIDNIESILQEADGIMVARGDLGIELNMEVLPSIQKFLISRALYWGKYTIVATQMLESMIENPRPTRAEVSDVANAIFDGSSAVMLSGETAVGKYPLEVVDRMRKIIIDAEEHIDLTDMYHKNGFRNGFDISHAVAHGASILSLTAHTSGILAFSTTGRSAAAISALRPQNRIYALTGSFRTFHRLAIQWGVSPVFASFSNLDDGVSQASKIGVEKGWLRLGDLIVVTYGVPFNRPGTTNTIQLLHIGEVFFRGIGIGKNPVEAPVIHNLPLKVISPHLAKNKIVVIIDFQPEYVPILKYAAGVLFVGYAENNQEEEQFLLEIAQLGIPCVYRAHGDISSVQEGLFVTLDPVNGTILAKKHGLPNLS
ncbi:MAG: pyruvate kinase [Chlamydiae bacterium]|nr:pyruvate kinase [Chlamydiota bacterium]